MSYEFTIVFSTKSAVANTIFNLRNSQMVDYSASNSVTLKDSQLQSTAPYDIGFSWEIDCTLSVDLIFKSKAIYIELIKAIDSNTYQCFGDCDEETSLEDIFKTG